MLNHKGTQTIETPRLLLRKALETDAEAMYRNWASDPQVTKFLTWPHYTSPETATQRIAIWCQQYPKADFYQWMIVPKALLEPIGTISVVEMNESVGEMEIGYCIGKPWWHQGIMTEAMEAVMAFCFTQVGALRVMARHDPLNPHSGGVMKKCGMQYEGTIRQTARNNTGICDISVYGMLKAEWEALHGLGAE